MQIVKYINHSRKVGDIARASGWLPGARYTNLRDVKIYERLGLLDIDWKSYDFNRHLQAARDTRPHLTIACDIEKRAQIKRVIDQAWSLLEYADQVAIVPKARVLSREVEDLFPTAFIFGYSVQTTYGHTRIPPECFRRKVHLLGGRPREQLSLGLRMDVLSLDCNSFTIDAAFGKYFDGKCYPKHPVGGYINCVRDSVKNINIAWESLSNERTKGRSGREARA